MTHPFPEEFTFDDPGHFTDPFRYTPHPLVRHAASEVISRIDADPNLRTAFSEGKMLGVLVCEYTHGGSQSRDKEECSARSSWQPHQDKSGHLCYIAAFSGNVDGRSCIDGFVPPIYDLTAPDGHFKEREAEITEINRRIEEMMDSDTMTCLKRELEEATQRRDMELAAMKASIAAAKKSRAEVRATCSDPDILDGLIRESQHEKAELRRLKQSSDSAIRRISERSDLFNAKIQSLKKLRAVMSEDLQDWIFRQYTVHNSLGEESAIADIFSSSGLVPPGGTGECAAPKLLEYAFRNSLKPLAMGEFWYGKSPDTAVRNHGRFYPSCTSKCGPLLKFMTKGLRIPENHASPSSVHTVSMHSVHGCISEEKIKIIYEDEAIVVVEKPEGIPSVPGLDGRKSMLEILSERMDAMKDSSANEHADVYPVHRLDMDTSGVMIFARTSRAAVNLRKQFEEHTIRKTYQARISRSMAGPLQAGAGGTVLPPWPQGEGPTKWEGSSLQHQLEGRPDEVLLQHMSEGGRQDSSSIRLPLAPDYDERPRQKVDFKQGKEAYTEYETVSENPDGTADIVLYPHTGRTHQLRVHCAHHLGLGRPIVGDLLYGGDSGSRLHLHALSISFLHPTTAQPLTFTSQTLSYTPAP